MTLTHPNGPTQRTRDVSVLPIFELEGDGRIPRHEMPDKRHARRTSRTRSSTTS